MTTSSDSQTTAATGEVAVPEELEKPPGRSRTGTGGGPTTSSVP